jgi:hypothetical protein
MGFRRLLGSTKTLDISLADTAQRSNFAHASYTSSKHRASTFHGQSRLRRCMATKHFASHRTFGRSPHALASRCVAGPTRSSGAPVLAKGGAATWDALGGALSVGRSEGHLAPS